MAELVKLKDTLTPSLKRQVKHLSNASRARVLSKMGNEFIRITKGAIGRDGKNRPLSWVPLSPRYAKLVGRKYATLYLTDQERIAVGKKGGPHLRDSIKEVDCGPKSVTILADSPYAAEHQLGKNGLPERPYFPVMRKKLTSYAHSRITEILKAWMKEPRSRTIK